MVTLVHNYCVLDFLAVQCCGQYYVYTSNLRLSVSSTYKLANPLDFELYCNNESASA